MQRLMGLQEEESLLWQGGRVRTWGLSGGAGRRKRRSRGLRGFCRWRVLLFEADVPQVAVIDADDAVVLLEEALLLGLPSPLQTLDQQAKSPARFRNQSARRRGGRRQCSR